MRRREIDAFARKPERGFHKPSPRQLSMFPERRDGPLPGSGIRNAGQPPPDPDGWSSTGAAKTTALDS